VGRAACGAILDRDITALAGIWAENYTFITPQGELVTREERLANLGSGSTNVQIIDTEREITVRLYGDPAVMQNLSTLRGSFSGAPSVSQGVRNADGYMS
jgi:hypothetical protein